VADLPPLVASDDPDLTLFKSGDEGFFLRSAMREVRRYCNWHIAPSRAETNVRRPVTREGVILLQSLYVTSVESVTVDGRVLTPDEYTAEECGVIHRNQPSWPRDDFATVSFTHGYPEAPEDVKLVCFELMATAKDAPSGNLKSMATIGFQYQFGGFGMQMTDDHRSRLASYRVETFG
jgi:hypothetical protein